MLSLLLVLKYYDFFIVSFTERVPNPVVNTEKIDVKKTNIKTNLKEKQHKTSCFTSHVYRCTFLAPVII